MQKLSFMFSLISSFPSFNNVLLFIYHPVAASLLLTADTKKKTYFVSCTNRKMSLFIYLAAQYSSFQSKRNTLQNEFMYKAIQRSDIINNSSLMYYRVWDCYQIHILMDWLPQTAARSNWHFQSSHSLVRSCIFFYSSKENRICFWARTWKCVWVVSSRCIWQACKEMCSPFTWKAEIV